MSSSLDFPRPFVSPAGAYLVIPLNEGVAYPVEEIAHAGRKLPAYSAYGRSKPRTAR
jgi:hypothetical protein